MLCVVNGPIDGTALVVRAKTTSPELHLLLHVSRPRVPRPPVGWADSLDARLQPFGFLLGGEQLRELLM